MPNWDNKLKLLPNTVCSVANFIPTLIILHHPGWWHFPSLMLQRSEVYYSALKCIALLWNEGQYSTEESTATGHSSTEQLTVNRKCNDRSCLRLRPQINILLWAADMQNNIWHLKIRFRTHNTLNKSAQVSKIKKNVPIFSSSFN